MPHAHVCLLGETFLPTIVLNMQTQCHWVLASQQNLCLAHTGTHQQITLPSKLSQGNAARQAEKAGESRLGTFLAYVPAICGLPEHIRAGREYFRASPMKPFGFFERLLSRFQICDSKSWYRTRYPIGISSFDSRQQKHFLSQLPKSSASTSYLDIFLHFLFFMEQPASTTTKLSSISFFNIRSF